MGFPRPLPIAWMSGILVASLLALTCLNLPSPAAKPKLCLGSTRRYHFESIGTPGGPPEILDYKGLAAGLGKFKQANASRLATRIPEIQAIGSGLGKLMQVS